MLFVLFWGPCLREAPPPCVASHGYCWREWIVVQLNELGIKAPRGGVWSLAQVQRLLKRVAFISVSQNPNAEASYANILG